MFDLYTVKYIGADYITLDIEKRINYSDNISILFINSTTS